MKQTLGSAKMIQKTKDSVIFLSLNPINKINLELNTKDRIDF